MMKPARVAALTLARMLMLGARTATAQQTFESAVIDGLDLGAFGGFNWLGFVAYNNVAGGYCSGSFTFDYGYCNGVVSGNQAVYNASGGDAQVSSASLFSFQGAWFSAAFTTDPQLSGDPRANAATAIAISGFSGATQLFSTVFNIAIKAPAFLSVSWNGIDRLEFSSRPNPGQSAQVVMDDIFLGPATPPPPTTAPEPATMALLATGLAGLGVVRRRRRTT